MSFTILFAIFALFVLIVVFGLSYKLKGLNIALIATAVTFIFIAILFIAIIYAITIAM